MKQLSIVCLLLLSASIAYSQSARQKALNVMQEEKGDIMTAIALSEKIKLIIENIESGTEPYNLINKTFEIGNEEPCSCVFLISEMAKESQRNLLYSFNISDLKIDFVDQYADGILPMNLKEGKAAKAEAYQDAILQKEAQVLTFDIAAEKESIVKLQELFEELALLCK